MNAVAGGGNRDSPALCAERGGSCKADASGAPGPGHDLKLQLQPDADTLRTIPSWEWLKLSIDPARSRAIVISARRLPFTWIAMVTLSDAVAADNFTVLHAKISKPFRDQFPPEKLREVFKDLIDKRAVFDAVVAKPIVPDADAMIDNDGVLRLKGHFETTPKQVKYQLGFIPSDGVWKLSAVTINIE